MNLTLNGCVPADASFGPDQEISHYLTKTGRQAVFELLAGQTLSVNFQPIFSAQGGTIYGYEALTYVTDKNSHQNSISGLFKQALSTKATSFLDVLCREKAIRQAAVQGIRKKSSFLFINICPETLMDPGHRVGITDEITEEYGLSREKIILEITEETAIHNFDLLQQSVTYYRNRGYKIAIDDFGAGYGGLKMLSLIQPDFIKIDRHFISEINKNPINAILVDTLVRACHRIGIQVIAEGVEQEEEFKSVLGLGIELLQGYYFARPSSSLTAAEISITSASVSGPHLKPKSEGPLPEVMLSAKAIGISPQVATLPHAV